MSEWEDELLPDINSSDIFQMAWGDNYLDDYSMWDWLW
jgi:hypothetical protein